MALPAAAISGAETNSIGILPLSGDWLVYKSKPGEQINDTVVVHNPTDQTVTVKLYPVDAYTTTQGGFALQNETSPRKQVGQWVELSDSLVTLKPGENRKVTFRMRVPEQLLPGEYAGGIIAELPPRSSNVVGSDQKKNVQLSIVERVGVRIYLTIPGTVRESLQFRKPLGAALHYWKGYVDFTAELLNEGNISAKPKGSLQILRNGQVIQTIPVSLDAMLPQGAFPIHVRWTDYPLWGKYDVVLTITYGETRELTVQSQTSVMIIPWTWIIGIAAFLIFLVGAIWLLKGRVHIVITPKK
ncbi:hypothetical protein SD70_15720 [Gordoniibacillus kamchatkensis]|uniref:WxL Interacting Protein peptidoglycan binding domain-containing protein n=2 Tax=Gordoniibacillus kamchatkensis TaxID=1590651 RepID=A0ABR5AGE3_9BACL|nr:hypothetical protein SD70_15720 [Paenibacillus sp. VKM B-2647]